MQLQFDADDQELQLFLAENNDHLQLLDQNIVQLEQSPDDQQLLQSIFRSAHTIKGGAGLIGHQRMTELAHAMENVLDGLRSHALVVTPATIDALLAALDALRVLNGEVITREETDVALEPVLAMLHACLAPGAPAAEAAPQSAPAPAAVPPQQVELAGWELDEALQAELATVAPSHVHAIAVTIDPDCGLNAARTFQVYLELQRSTRVLRVTPSADEIEQDDQINTLRALVVADELPSLLEHRIAGMADVMDVRVTSPSDADASSAVETSDLSDWQRDAELDALLDGVDTDSLYDVVVTVDPDCGLSAARILQVYLELQRSTRLLRATPSPDEIEQDEAINALRGLLVATEAPAALRKRLSGMPDVIEVGVARVLVEGVPALVAPAAATDEAPRAAGALPTPTVAEPIAAAAAVAAPGRRAEAARPAATDKPVQQETSIRISVSILDDLMSLVSELVLGRTRLQTLRTQLQERYKDDESVVNLEDAVGHLDRISNDLQTTVMKARMLPVENVFNKFPRLMRDLAAQSGKQVNFTMSGQETELDRSVIEQLSDPLIHLLRNAIDHGMESPEERVAAGKPRVGAISLAATAAENHILIEVRDDGRGIDGDKVKASAVKKGFITAEAASRLSEREAQELVFAAGLSTAKAITDISGRGVGMDIVKATIERMGGHITIDSTVGQGTTFAVTLPLTLAIMQALLVSVDDAVYALPLNTVTEILSVDPAELHMLQGTEATMLRGTILPIVRLREYFACPPAPPASTVQIVATRVDGQLLGLAVDHFIGEQEIVMKPLGSYMGTIRGLAGATILGDGRIGLLVDVATIRDWRPAHAA